MKWQYDNGRSRLNILLTDGSVVKIADESILGSLQDCGTPCLKTLRFNSLAFSLAANARKRCFACFGVPITGAVTNQNLYNIPNFQLEFTVLFYPITDSLIFSIRYAEKLLAFRTGE